MSDREDTDVLLDLGENSISVVVLYNDLTSSLEGAASQNNTYL